MNHMHTHDVNALKIIMTALTYIVKNRDEIRHNIGICGNIYHATFILKMKRTKAVDTEMKNLFALWPKFSGDKMYPIKSTNYMCEERMYMCMGVENRLWDRISKYGRMRWELAYFMIRRARQLIKDIESSTNADNGV